MEFKKPKPKKKNLDRKLILPLTKKEMTGIFNGQFVIVSNMESMNYLYEAGNFGKGTLSRGRPTYHVKEDDIPKILLQHQFENHSKWNENFASCYSLRHIGAMKDFDLSLQSITSLFQSSFSDFDKQSWKSWKEKHNLQVENLENQNESRKTDSSLLEFKIDDYAYRDENFMELVNEILESGLLKKQEREHKESDEVIVLDSCFDINNAGLSPANISPRLERSELAKENLNLNLEESFFLKSELGCLNIVDLNLSELGMVELWERFNAVDRRFTEKYVTYHYYRAKGWVVKSGLKFGGDFLLYKDGPSHYHSSYLMKVLDRKKKVTWREFVMMNRLVETFNKELILCKVFPVKASGGEGGGGGLFPEAFTKNSIQEILAKRWFPSKERLSKEGKPS